MVTNLIMTTVNIAYLACGRTESIHLPKFMVHIRGIQLVIKHPHGAAIFVLGVRNGQFEDVGFTSILSSDSAPMA